MEQQKSIVNHTANQVKDIDSKQGIVTIYANAFNNTDSDKDISLPGSFAKTISENKKRIRHFLNHRTDKLIGFPKEMTEDSHGLLVVSQLNMKVNDGKDTFEHYKLFAENGLTLEHSVGVNAIKYDINEEENVRKVSEWKLWEYSTLHAWGANELTPMVSMKENLELALRKGNFTDGYFKQIEKKLNELLALINEPQYKSTHEENEPLNIDYMKNSIKF